LTIQKIALHANATNVWRKFVSSLSFSQQA